ncbi:MAG: hypothetical protein ABL863_12795 [Nitrosomonas sp.]
MSEEIEKILVLPKAAHRYSLRPAFALNRALREIRILARKELQSLGESQIAPHIVPYLFNKRSRTFLTFGFTDKALTAEDEEVPTKILGRIRELVTNTTDSELSVERWKHYFQHVNSSNQGSQKKIAECLQLKNDAEFRESLKGISYDEWMDIYIHHQQHRKMYLNGLFFNLLHEDKIEPFDALVLDVRDPTGKTILVHSLSCSQQKWCELGKREQLGIGGDDLRIHFKLTALFALPETAPQWVLLVPIYDYYIAGKAYGGICATLQIPYYKDELDLSEGGLASVAVRKLISCAPIISLEIAASGVERAIRDAVAPRHTAISEFVSGLRYLQDWQCIEATFSNSFENAIFSRAKTSDSDWADSKLSIESSNGECTESCRETMDTLSWSRSNRAIANDVALEYIEGMEKNLNELSGLEKIEFHFPKYFRLPDMKIKDDDGAEIENHYWRAYCDNLIRQQRELLSVLMPKLRARKAALRSAVSAIMGRNMSHNIGSHVLARYSSAIKKDLIPAEDGTTDHRSDFLSYLQRRMDFLAEIATSDEAFWSQPLSLKQQISRLNYRVQKERFIGSHGSHETCKKADCPGKDAKQCNTSHEQCTYRLYPHGSTEIANDPIVLSFITGKESLLANVEYGKPGKWCDGDNGNCRGGYLVENQEEPWFACPGGEVGVHALYVILENIIRNSARHSADDHKGVVSIFVEIDQNKSTENLIKLVIIDPRTKLEPDGRIVNGKSTPDEASKENIELGKDGKYRKYSIKEDDKRKKLICLDNEINSILWDEPFLDENSKPNPHYWGLREMQVCANYLRGIPLSDLEGKQDGSKPALEAIVKELPGGSHCLAYELYVQRAKLLTVVTTDKKIFADSAHSARGIGVIPFEMKQGDTAIQLSEDQWLEAINASRGYGFVAVMPEIKFPPTSLLPSLPMRTYQIEVGIVEDVLADSLINGDKLKWMELLHRMEGCRYREKRPQWKNGQYWGLNALEALDEEHEIMEGAWRQVRLNLEQGEIVGGIHADRLMWPLGTNHIDILRGLNQDNDDIAAIWIDHPKPEYFKRNDRLGRKVGLEQAAMPSCDDTIRRWIQVEAVFSDSPHKVALQESDATHCQELLAAALPRVAVLDERVQSGENTAIREIPLSKLWSSMGVWVPVKTDCDLDNPKLDNVRKFLENPTEHNEQLPIDFLILHLTVLERLHKEARTKATQTFAETLGSLTQGTKAESAHVVVVTGRGVPSITNKRDPDYLPEVRYLPVSAILEYLVARPSKLALMRVLWSAARPASN